MEQEDFVRELGYLGFTTRLKRLSDNLMHEGRRFYKELKLDIEPNWFVIFMLLKQKGSLSVTEISEFIRMAHPSVIAITNKMMKAGYLISAKDEDDSRKRLLSLSDHAQSRLRYFETIWEAGRSSMEKALAGTDALQMIDQLEDVFEEKGFKERTQESLEAGEEVVIENYDEAYAPHFAQLNLEWLEKYFVVEDYDREVLNNPNKYILEPGGMIFFARVGDEIAGTVALIKRETGVYELSKMAVTESFKGRKIGLKLMQTCIDYGKSNNYKSLFLDSNTKLVPAMKLYEKVGFKEIPVPEDTPYDRCNIRMRLPLS